MTMLHPHLLPYPKYAVSLVPTAILFLLKKKERKKHFWLLHELRHSLKDKIAKQNNKSDFFFFNVFANISSQAKSDQINIQLITVHSTLNLPARYKRLGGKNTWK